VPKYSPEQLFTVMGGKFKFSAQESALAPLFEKGTKVKMPSEIKSPLKKTIFLLK
jgi:hypothetical protein